MALNISFNSILGLKTRAIAISSLETQLFELKTELNLDVVDSVSEFMTLY